MRFFQVIALIGIKLISSTMVSTEVQLGETAKVLDIAVLKLHELIIIDGFCHRLRCVCASNFEDSTRRELCLSRDLKIATLAAEVFKDALTDFRKSKYALDVLVKQLIVNAEGLAGSGPAAGSGLAADRDLEQTVSIMRSEIFAYREAYIEMEAVRERAKEVGLNKEAVLSMGLLFNVMNTKEAADAIRESENVLLVQTRALINSVSAFLSALRSVQ